MRWGDVGGGGEWNPYANSKCTNIPVTEIVRCSRKVQLVVPWVNGGGGEIRGDCGCGIRGDCGGGIRGDCL